MNLEVQGKRIFVSGRAGGTGSGEAVTTKVVGTMRPTHSIRPLTMRELYQPLPKHLLYIGKDGHYYNSVGALRDANRFYFLYKNPKIFKKR